MVSRGATARFSSIARCLLPNPTLAGRPAPAVRPLGGEALLGIRRGRARAVAHVTAPARKATLLGRLAATIARATPGATRVTAPSGALIEPAPAPAGRATREALDRFDRPNLGTATREDRPRRARRAATTATAERDVPTMIDVPVRRAPEGISVRRRDRRLAVRGRCIPVAPSPTFDVVLATVSATTVIRVVPGRAVADATRVPRPVRLVTPGDLPTHDDRTPTYVAVPVPSGAPMAPLESVVHAATTTEPLTVGRPDRRATVRASRASPVIVDRACHHVAGVRASGPRAVTSVPVATRVVAPIADRAN